MRAELVHSPEMEEYRLSPTHPLKPERFTLALELARQWGLVGEGGATVVRPDPATDAELLFAHDAGYVAAVKRASADPGRWPGGFGIGPGDTPAFAHMHEAAALAAGGTARALRDVVAGVSPRAFNLAGGLHHAHRDRAAGFCVYNDLAVAIASRHRRAPRAADRLRRPRRPPWRRRSGGVLRARRRAHRFRA